MLSHLLLCHNELYCWLGDNQECILGTDTDILPLRCSIQIAICSSYSCHHRSDAFTCLLFSALSNHTRCIAWKSRLSLHLRHDDGSVRSCTCGRGRMEDFFVGDGRQWLISHVRKGGGFVVGWQWRLVTVGNEGWRPVEVHKTAQRLLSRERWAGGRPVTLVREEEWMEVENLIFMGDVCIQYPTHDFSLWRKRGELSPHLILVIT